MTTNTTAPLNGLSLEQAAAKLTKDGPNELPSTKPRGILKIAFEVVKEPMFLLLLACGTIYLISGDLTEALMLLGFVFVVMGITFHQERKTERALDALRDLSSPKALVIRDGQKQRIDSREVVPDDLIILSEGDRIPADALLVAGTNLSIDESLLTGESLPVRKREAEGDIPASKPGGDDLPFVYSGTLVVQGQGTARVTMTGINTEIGKIGKALNILETEDSPLQKQTARLVRLFALIGISLCVLVVVIYGITRGDWLAGFLAGLSLAMAMLPEEFPVVLTIFLALGAWRISRVKVLTRRMPAVETLGATTVLCVDKTGTLTMNKMSVREIYVTGQVYFRDKNWDARPATVKELERFGVLSCKIDPFDPMEKAIKELATTPQAEASSEENLQLEREYPLSKEYLSVTNAWRQGEASEYVVAAKGAPETILALCHLPEGQRTSLLEVVEQMSRRGLRVLGVAKGNTVNGSLPDDQHGFDFDFLGFIGLADPVRPGVAEAVGECYSAGIRTIMITGDYPGTAQNIASEIGLRNPDICITGTELEAMTDEELALRIMTVNVFARMVPEQKLRLVRALKSNGEVVAMTGDGVNDAPALKAAHIGIAMGGRGTDVAREASSIVLLEDDFASIVEAIKMGRRIFDNLQKAMRFIFSVHVPIAGLALLPVVLKMPLILFPVHIVFLELIIDPVCSVVFEGEAAEKGIMRRPPRPLNDPLFGRSAILTSLFQGFIILCASFGIYYWALGDHSEQAARALAFATLVLSNIGLILTNRSQQRFVIGILRVPNKALWWVLGITAVMLVSVLLIPFMQDLLRFAAVHAVDFAMVTGFSVTTLLLMEAKKAIHLFTLKGKTP